MIEVDEYKFLCWLTGKVPSAIVIRNLFRKRRSMKKMTIKEVYKRYKHLDNLLSDKTFLSGFRAHILYELWQAVKKECEKK